MSRDLKFVDWLGIASGPLLARLDALGGAVRTAELKPVAEAFVANARRVVRLSNLPTTVLDAGRDKEYDTAVQWAWLEGFPGPRDPATAHEIFSELSQRQEFADAVELLMSLQVIASWSAFETLAGDLWVAAVDAHPAGLARLNGSPNRIKNLARGKPDKAGVVPVGGQDDAGDLALNLADLYALTHGTFDIQHRVGELLVRSGRVKFVTLDGIRSAYSRAFSHKEKRASTDWIDGPLKSDSLDAMSAIRNLLIHKAGVADPEYIRKREAGRMAPTLSLGQRIDLDGSLVRTLIDPVTICGVSLIEAVDKWLFHTRRDDGEGEPPGDVPGP